jgi:hypothetical protein
VPVAQGAGDHGQGGEWKELCVDHPLQIKRRQAHVLANRRQCDRDDGAANEHETAAQARSDEHLGAFTPTAGPRLGQRQAAVGKDQGRSACHLAAHYVERFVAREPIGRLPEAG